jgi:hypothetical protein
MTFHAELRGQRLGDVTILDDEIGRIVAIIAIIAIIAFFAKEATIVLLWLCAPEWSRFVALARLAFLVRL